MTTLSQYLSAEEPDYTEEASFYVAGAKGWGDPYLRWLRSRVRESATSEERLYPTLEAQEDE